MAKRKNGDEDSDDDFIPSAVDLANSDNQVDLLPVRSFKNYSEKT